ncbi:YpdA family putative bacillithiol disulfide reductase [Belliella kenyensis]|uniref:YpdA family putative bacillithiol disulfide reductase n=1 Tax=Belliella kenyensis TaxID=1472724 RepID=A0ABV8EP76_9BACT|nr:YpdA family putative bacillithiol disulfide reductase [Belliella kenyensis]MCH7402846.1 YpdA family putative bacillithiol disulfide reductase [Belliella kenyensis]MDN3602552.1 YpdA family putative bacillithiol disulfide reductase [Belliella kenyensis]
MEVLDVLIIGGGPIGIACGIACEEAGLRYVIVEKGVLTNSLYHYPLNMTFFSTSDKLEMGGVPFMSVSHKPTRTEALEYYRRVVEKWKLKINLYEKVEKMHHQGQAFEIKTSKCIYQAKNIILATGFYDLPNLMNVPGEDLPKVKHYYKEPWPYIGQKVLVVGGANSAVDVALETWRKGAEVTMLLKGEGIDPNVKYWVKPDIENRIKEGSIKAFTSSLVKEIRENEVVIETPEGDVTIENDFVLAMTGYVPNFSLLDQLGVTLSIDEKRQPCYDQTNQESNIPGVYLAGVVCGGLNTREFFIENSIVHAEHIVSHILGKREVDTL